MKSQTYAEHQSIAANSFDTNKVINTTVEQNKLTQLVCYLSYGFGACAIVFATLSLATNMNLIDILLWIGQYFGLSFSLLFGLLLATGVWSVLRLHGLSTAQANEQSLCETPVIAIQRLLKQRIFWHQVGMQTANGISTLALTYTLLGISLGIGSLSEQSLSPENVNNVISILTTQFSMAFMTTVVGLPTATGLRAYLSILYAKQDATCGLGQQGESVNMITTNILEEQS